MPLMQHSGLEHIYQIRDEEANGIVNKQTGMWSRLKEKQDNKI